MVDSSYVLSFENLFSPEILLGLLILLIIGFLILRTVVKKPNLFWPLLIVVNIIGNEPKIRGYFLLDELFTGFIVMGAFLWLLSKKISLQKNYGLDLHKKIFLLWVGYMVVQSFIGIWVNNDLRIFRWVLFYFMLGLTMFLLSKNRNFRFPTPRQVSLIVLFTTVAVYIVYLVQGVYFENLLGQWGRFLSQDFFWAGSAYAVFPAIIAMPAAILLLGDKSFRARLLAWVSIVIMMAVAFYFDSRVLWFVIAGYLLISVRRLKPSHIFIILLIFCAEFILFIPSPIESAPDFFAYKIKTAEAAYNPQPSDLTRNLAIRAALITTAENSKTLLFGNGIYSHRFALIPATKSLLEKNLQYLPPEKLSQVQVDLGKMAIVRTMSFNALLVDTGLIGMLLFFANFAIAAFKIFSTKSQNRILFLATIFMAFLWLFVNNITDIILLYLLIMPGGLIEQWNASTVKKSR